MSFPRLRDNELLSFGAVCNQHGSPAPMKIFRALDGLIDFKATNVAGHMDKNDVEQYPNGKRM